MEMKTELQEQVLSPIQLMKSTYHVVNERFGSFLLLTLLVYIPVTFVMQYKMLHLEINMDDTLMLLSQAIDVFLVQIVMTFVELVAILVGAVLVQNVLLGDGKMSFGSALYQGVRRWLHGAFTLIMILMIVWMGLIPLMLMPGMLLLIMPMAVLLTVYLGMLQAMVGSGAALRRYTGLRNLRYVFFLLKGRMWPAFKAFALTFIATGAISMLGEWMLNNMLSGIAQDWLFLLVSTIFGALLSMVGVFNYAAGSVLFLNLEELRREEMEELKRQ